MAFEPAADETLLHSCLANLMRGWEGVGGRLHLTDRRLVFVAHSLNVQTGTTEIPLDAIRDLRTEWSRFVGVPMAPNGLRVRSDAGDFRFVVWGRKALAQRIRDQVPALR